MGDKHTVKITSSTEVPAEKVENFIHANALPGDTVVVYSGDALVTAIQDYETEESDNE